MNVYRFEIVTQYVRIVAESEEEAEAQYANYWSGENCRNHPDQNLEEESCGCVVLYEGDIYHNTELIGRE